MQSITRILDVNMATVSRLLRLAGWACAIYHRDHVRNIPGKRLVQCDEIWSFVYAKRKYASYVEPWDYAGDIWTFTALDANSKLLIAYFLAPTRNTRNARLLLADVASRLEETPSLVTDRLKSYTKAAKQLYGKKSKYILSQTRKGETTDHSTSFIERHNLTIRMSNRRYARKTNAFSKSAARHIDMFNLFAIHYNFCRIHKSLRVTPAMEAGLTNVLRDCEWIVGLINEIEPKPKKPGPKPKIILKT